MSAVCFVNQVNSQDFPSEGLSRHRMRISTSLLTVGMYVEAVDRPWEETEFAFQGFYLQSKEDCQLLREHCDYAYVVVTKALQKDINRGCQLSSSAKKARFDGRQGGCLDIRIQALQEAFH